MAARTARRHGRNRIMVSDVVAIGMLMLATACTSDSTAAPEFAAGGRDVVLEWGVHHPAVMIWPGITLKTNAIEVREHFELPCWPYTARASVRRDGNVLVLRLTGEPADGCSEVDVAGLAYRATIPLASGELVSEVRVEHRWSDLPERRYDRTLR